MYALHSLPSPFTLILFYKNGMLKTCAIRFLRPLLVYFACLRMTGMVMAQEMVMTTGWSYTHLPLRQILQYWATKGYEAVIIGIYRLMIHIYSSK